MHARETREKERKTKRGELERRALVGQKNGARVRTAAREKDTRGGDKNE